MSNKTQNPTSHQTAVSSRFFFFVYSFCIWGDKTLKGKGNISVISNGFPKMQDVTTFCRVQVQKNYDDKFNKIDIIIENWIEMSEDDFERFVS